MCVVRCPFGVTYQCWGRGQRCWSTVGLGRTRAGTTQRPETKLFSQEAEEICSLVRCPSLDMPPKWAFMLVSLVPFVERTAAFGL